MWLEFCSFVRKEKFLSFEIVSFSCCYVWWKWLLRAIMAYRLIFHITKIMWTIELTITEWPKSLLIFYHFVLSMCHSAVHRTISWVPTVIWIILGPYTLPHQLCAWSVSINVEQLECLLMNREIFEACPIVCAVLPLIHTLQSATCYIRLPGVSTDNEWLQRFHLI